MSRSEIRMIASACMTMLLFSAGSAALAAGVNARPQKDAEAAAGSQQWRTLTPEDLAMSVEPKAAGAAAIYLYRQVDRDDTSGTEITYQQIKVLSEEGRNLANIEIPYVRERETILDIEARVVHPDGTIVPFSGKVYDRPLQANKELGVYAKSFTMQDVRVGSVLEYRFRHRYDVAGYLYHSRWVLSQPLFTRYAKFSLRLGSGAGVRWSWPVGLPEGTVAPKQEKNLVRMEIRNVPAFATEDYMPPPGELALTVYFTYVEDLSPTADPLKFWAEYGGTALMPMDRFLGDPRDLRDQVAGIVAAGDSNEQKVRKIYSHVQKLNNMDEPALSGQNKKDPKDCKRAYGVRDVAKNGCGGTEDLELYFIALVRAAGLPAFPAVVASRRERFFQPQAMLTTGLDGLVAAVTIDGKEVLLQPAISYVPYGSLPWTDTAVPAFKLNKQGAQWITTPMPKAQDAVTQRRAKLVLSADGVLQGTVTVRHAGHEAIQRLAALRQADEQTRTDMMVEDLRRAIAVPADIALLRQPDLDSRSGVIETEYRVTVSQWALSTGNRIMVGIGLFGKEQAGKFVAPRREHPIYFSFPFTTEDDVEITLPAGFRLQGAPAARLPTSSALAYSTSVESRNGVVSIHRSLTHEVLLAKETQYPRFQSFYELVRTGDQEQLVLTN